MDKHNMLSNKIAWTNKHTSLLRNPYITNP